MAKCHRSSHEPSWQTSNMQYGRFFIDSQGDAASQFHRANPQEREGRCEVLTKSLIDCRKQLGNMRLRDAHPLPPNALDDDMLDPPTSSYLYAHQQRLNMGKKIAPIRRSSKTYRDYEDGKSTYSNPRSIQATPLISHEQEMPQVTSASWIDTSGIEEDTKQLEWLLNRLADKLQPFADGELTHSNDVPITNLKKKKGRAKQRGP
ncbi:hypothetical protein KP509_09G010000 [Ceratopteris richardii]|uniref:Uncharacterized protein n=1 Tax=Ceratopteris richardii TaxID=49495 RepID=A0A8T2U073_CERRI|nr:hypothetical protein KP509_09G010000 [Ceratopteris richardii]